MIQLGLLFLSSLWLLPGRSPRKRRFDPGLGLVRFMVDKLAQGKVLYRVILFPSQYHPTNARSHVCSHAVLAKGSNGRNQSNFNIQSS